MAIRQRGAKARLALFARVLCATVMVGMTSVAGMAVHAASGGFTLVAGTGWSGWLSDPASQANFIGLGDLVTDPAGNLYVSESWGNRISKITPEGQITTLAGNAGVGFGGDGGPASAAMISGPTGLARDAAGRLYFSDSRNHRVRRIDAAGVVTTVVGNGVNADAGDGGQALAASLMGVSGLAIDASGNLFIADPVANRIRKVASDGTITTVAGTGTAGYSGDNGPATAAQLNSPSGIDVDADGSLYIADTSNSAVRKVATDGTITTFYTSTVAFPYNVAVSPTGAIYTMDINACTVLRYDSGAWATFSGTGNCADAGDGAMPQSATTGAVDGIAFDAQGNLFLADNDFGRIRKVHASDGVMRNFAGLGNVGLPNGLVAAGTEISGAQGIAVSPEGRVGYVEGPWTRKVREVNSDGILATRAGDGEISPSNSCAFPCSALAYSLLSPYATAWAPNGNLYVSDRALNQVYSIDASNTITLVAGRRGSMTGNGDGGPATSAKIDANGIAFDAAGNLYIADQLGNAVRKVDASGTITTLATTAAPNALAADAAGNVFVYERDNRRILKIAASDQAVTTFAGNGSTEVSGDGGKAIDAGIGAVGGIATDGTTVYFSSNGRIRRVTGTGKIESIGGWSYYATGLAIRSDTLYVATQNGRIVRAPLAQLVTQPAHVAHDFDGDGRSDLFWHHATRNTNSIWRTANSKTETAVTTVTDAAWKIVGVGDFDGDGRSDVVWRNNRTGANSIWRSANSPTQLSVAGVTNLEWQVVGVGDFDGDGRSDLFWRNTSTGANAIWRSADYRAQIPTVGVTNLAWQVVGIGDFNADGRSDVVWHNTTDGSNGIWKSGNNATQQLVTRVTDLNWKIVGVGDFDGDGRADLAWRHATTGADSIWKAGVSTNRIAMISVALAWKIQRVADFDGDGRSDLFWRNTSTGANTIWRGADNTTQLQVTGVTDQGWGVTPFENQP